MREPSLLFIIVYPLLLIYAFVECETFVLGLCLAPTFYPVSLLYYDFLCDTFDLDNPYNDYDYNMRELTRIYESGMPIEEEKVINGVLKKRIRGKMYRNEYEYRSDKLRYEDGKDFGEWDRDYYKNIKYKVFFRNLHIFIPAYIFLLFLYVFTVFFVGGHYSLSGGWAEFLSALDYLKYF